MTDQHQPHATHVSAAEPRASRRQLLRLAGAAATGAAASIALHHSGADAADGEAVTLGQHKTATSRTRADYTGAAGGQAFLFQAGNTYSGEAGYVSAALAGWTAATQHPHGIFGYTSVGTGSGVYGRADGASTTGVFGRADGTSASGVVGQANAAGGHGVRGVNTNGIGVKAEGTTTGLRADSSGAGSTAVVGIAPATGVGVAGEGLVGVQGIGFGTGSVGVEAGLPVTETGVKARGKFAVDAEGLQENAIAVYGRAPDGYAGRFDGAVGVKVDATAMGLNVGSTGLGAVIFGQRAALWLGGGANPVVDSPQHHQGGEIAVDDFNTLWYCTNSGFPGTWRTLSGQGAAGAFYPTPPTRVYDSRKPSPAPLTTGSSRTISVADGIDANGVVNAVGVVPSFARAITYNITVVNTVASGWLSVVPGTVGSVASSTINWTASGATIANGTTVGLQGNRQITVSCGGVGAATNFIIDITGYYR